MKEKLLNNLSLKILAVVIAVITWAVIVNVTNPADTKTINGVTVNMLNENALTDKGYTYEILDGSKITVYVKGPKSDLSNITVSDIYATADFSTISPVSDYVNIEAKCTKTGKSGSELEVVLKTNQVKINIENRETKNFDVDISITGNPAAGYAVGDCEVSPMSVKITGAESVIESIDRVVAEYDIEGASMDISESVKLRLYDAEGSIINDSNLVFSRQEVRIKIPILVRKKVPVSYATIGYVDENYTISTIRYSIEEIEIAGTASNIAGISEITIPAEKIDVTGLTTSKDYIIKINQYVPSNIKVLSSSNATVSVVVEPLTEQEFDYITSHATILNLSDNYECEISEDIIDVTYRGTTTNLEKIADNKIAASIDLMGLEEGEHQVKVVFTDIESCTPVGEYNVTVLITRLDNN